jgi:transposase
MAVRKTNTKKDAASGSPGDDGAEVVEERVEVVRYAAAIDVAKGFGMVCTRVPGSRPDRKRQKVWPVEATYDSVVALMDHLRCEGIRRLVLESTSGYWRIWYYLAEAAGLEVWLVNAKDVKHLPGRGKSDREDSVWLCKLNERGMLRRSFVPPEDIGDLRSLTRTRSRLAQDQVRHQNRVEKILEDALLKISVVISNLFGASGRRFLDALVAGERSPRALAALGDQRLKATPEQLAGALTGRFREVHAFEIATHLRLIDAINDEIARLDARIEQQLACIPGVAPACTACGLIGGGHAPGCACEGTPVLGLVERLDEITGVGTRTAQVIIAELGTDMSVFPTPGHTAAWARLTPRSNQSGASARPGRTGKGNPYLRGALGQCVMAASRTDTRLGEQYRRLARRRGKQKAIVAVSRVICEISCLLIGDRAARFTDPGAGYYSSANPGRQTRSKIRQIERLNPGMKVTLTPIEPAVTAA